MRNAQHQDGREADGFCSFLLTAPINETNSPARKPDVWERVRIP